jgi:hypothetical protein
MFDESLVSFIRVFNVVPEEIAMKLRYRAAMLLTFLMFFSACSSTTQTGFWRDPEYRGKIRKVYVVGAAKLEINRYQFEDVFSSELQSRGVTAIPSYKDGNFPVALDEQAIAQRADANGADCVLVARALGKYGRQYEVDYRPTTATEYQIVTLEVIIYAIRTGQPIWSGQFEMILDRRYELLFSDFAKTVASDLKANGLI